MNEEQWLEIHEMIKMSLTGCGQFEINYQIKNLRDRLIYTHNYEFEDMYSDILLYYADGGYEDSFDEKKSSKSVYINNIVFNFLRKSIRKYEMKEYMEGTHYDTVIELEYEEDRGYLNIDINIEEDPDKLLMFKQFTKKLSDINEIYFFIYTKQITQKAAAKKLGIPKSTLNRQYNKVVKVLTDKYL